MKIYTEEQVIDAITKAFLAEYPSNGNDILKQLTPIELPSDVEIEKEAFQIPFNNTNEFYDKSFIKGAKWMKQQLQNLKNNL